MFWRLSVLPFQQIVDLSLTQVVVVSQNSQQLAKFLWVKLVSECSSLFWFQLFKVSFFSSFLLVLPRISFFICNKPSSSFIISLYCWSTIIIIHSPASSTVEKQRVGVCVQIVALALLSPFLSLQAYYRHRANCNSASWSNWSNRKHIFFLGFCSSCDLFYTIAS